MDELGSILSRSHTDVHLQAYLLRQLCRESPQTVLANAEEFVPVFAGFDADVTREILAELARHDLAEFSRFLLQLISADTRWFVQVEAINHLVTRTKEPRVLPTLVHLLGASAHTRVKSRILTALAEIKIDLPLRTIKPFLTHPDSRIRASALEALLTRDLTGLSEVFVLLLNDPAPRVKALAAVGLWRLGNPVLTSLLDDAEDPAQRVAFIYALGRTGRDAQTRRVLLRCLSSEDQAERCMACRSLGTVAEADDVPSLLEVAAELPGRDTRAVLSLTCERIDHDRTVQALSRMLETGEKDRQPRRQATVLSMFRAIAEARETGHASASWDSRVRIDATAGRDGPLVHRRAAGGLIASGPMESSAPRYRPEEPDVELLGRFLDSPDGRVRANAVEALSPYRELDSVREALLRSFGSDVARVKANAALPLWRSGYQSVMSGLRNMLSAGEPSTRAAGAWALGRIGGIVATGYLRRALDDTDESTRRLAFEGVSAQA